MLLNPVNRKKLGLIILGAILMIGVLGFVRLSRAIDCEDPSASYTLPDGSIDQEEFFQVQSTCNLRNENDPSAWSMLTGSFNAVLAFIFHLINKYILSPIIAFEAMLIPWLMDPAHFQFASSPLVHAGWYMSLQIANMIIVLGMLLVANRIILGIEKAFDYKKLLDYVVAAIVVNFSLTIAGFVIGVSNALTVYFIGRSEGGANMTNRLMQMTSVYTSMMLDTDNVAVGIFMLFIAVNMLVMLALIFGAILFTLIKRIVVLWITLIFLPIAYILGKFSIVKVKGAEDPWGKWQAQFMNAIMFPPLMGFFLWFTFLVMNRARDLYSAGNYDDQFWLQRLLQTVIFTGILIFGFQTANNAAGGAAGKIGELIDKTAKGWGVDKLAVGKAKQWGTRVSSAVGKQIAESKTGKWIEAKTAGTMFAGLGRANYNARIKGGENLKKEADSFAGLYADLPPEKLWAIATKAGMENTPEQAAAVASLNKKYPGYIKDQLKQMGEGERGDQRRYSTISSMRKTAKLYNQEFTPETLATTLMLKYERDGDEFYKALDHSIKNDPDAYKAAGFSDEEVREHLGRFKTRGNKDSVKAFKKLYLTTLADDAADLKNTLDEMTAREIARIGMPTLVAPLSPKLNPIDPSLPQEEQERRQKRSVISLSRKDQIVGTTYTLMGRLEKQIEAEPDTAKKAELEAQRRAYIAHLDSPAIGETMKRTLNKDPHFTSIIGGRLTSVPKERSTEEEEEGAGQGKQSGNLIIDDKGTVKKV